MLSEKRGSQIGLPEHLSPSAGRVDLAGARLQHQADVVGRLVADIGQQRLLALVQQLGQIFSTSLPFCTW